MFFTCPNISHSWKQETPTTTTLNSKNERYRRQQQLFAGSRMRTSFAPRVQTGRGKLKASSPLDPEEPSLSSIKQAPFFHCTIARLAAAHTFLMAEISRHALTDLRSESFCLLEDTSAHCVSTTPREQLVGANHERARICG